MKTFQAFMWNSFRYTRVCRRGKGIEVEIEEPEGIKILRLPAPGPHVRFRQASREIDIAEWLAQKCGLIPPMEGKGVA